MADRVDHRCEAVCWPSPVGGSLRPAICILQSAICNLHSPIFLLLLAASPALAHPVPSENHDRTILVRLTPTGVVVNYRLEVDEARAIRDIPQHDRDILAPVRTPRDFHAVFCRYFADILAGNLVATLDGAELA